VTVQPWGREMCVRSPAMLMVKRIRIVPSAPPPHVPGYGSET
jgi:hypothetical protein